MKRKIKFILGIPLAVVILFGAGLLSWFALAQPAEVTGGLIEGSKLADGVFEGNFRSGPNRAQVKVTIEHGHIARIDVLRNVASWIGKKAVPAVPERIVEAQSTRVDAVTGATHSSRVIMNAVQDAVDKSYAARESSLANN
jgi:uncharacterized protein with FMN-binding domain